MVAWKRFLVFDQLFWMDENEEKLKGNIVVIWLNIANTYGYVPHQLLFFALRQYRIPRTVGVFVY